ncbi:hypothetical protein ABZ468_53455 [Streptomyces sp. NPDC005708]|uniref:hypothetical protein n=1 Tax=Streptomyces sp. NPDC005708 TaxID=3154564 RepID=UPI0033C5587C
MVRLLTPDGLLTSATYLMLAGHLVLPLVVHHRSPGLDTARETGRASALCPRLCAWLAVLAGVAGLLLANATVLSSLWPGCRTGRRCTPG